VSEAVDCAEGREGIVRLVRSALATLLALFIWAILPALPVSARSANLPLGVATGSKEAQIARDGKRWGALTSASSPAYEGTVLRTGNGAAALLLHDGTQLELHPRSVIGLSGSRTAPMVKIALGRVLFRLAAASPAVLAAPSVRYHPAANGTRKNPTPIRVAAISASASDRVGEIIVSRKGGSHIGLQQGEMLARRVNDPGLLIVKAGHSAYTPKAGATDPSFRALLAQALPAGVSPPPVGAIPVYDQPGRSLGFCRTDGSFVSSPGITRNLRSPAPGSAFPPGFIIKVGASPLFRSEPAYVGSLDRGALTEADPPHCNCPIPIYDSPGKNVGYINSNGSLVSCPGCAPDLTTAVPASAVPSGLAHQPDATPVFTVEPAYVGYLLDDRFIGDVERLGCRILFAMPVAGAAAGALGGIGTGVGSTGVALGGAGALAILSTQNDRPVASSSGF